MKVKDFFTKNNNEIVGDISMYVCGPTVYDSPHIGNMRPVVIFDILNRVSSLKRNVTYVHNITDIDDKIIQRSLELGITEKELSTKYEKEYLDLLKELNVITPTYMPRVTDYIHEIIYFISELINDGHAYESNGSVYFAVDKWENYGLKGNLILDHLEDKEDSKDKKYSKDFALWKKTIIGSKFKSPWGQGRPGWHTECAFFVKKIFGNNGITIHGGGIDLRFPHHINEMAQYEAYTGKELSKNWLYVGHISVNSKKMSKSLGNIFTAKDFIQKYNANVLRMVLISTDYMKPIELTNDVIINSENSLLKIKNALIKAMVSISMDNPRDIKDVNPSQEIIEFLENNLDTSSSITYIFSLVKELNLVKDKIRKEDLVEVIIANMKLLGFKYDTKFNLIKNEIALAKENHDYTYLDQLKKELF